MTRAPHDHKHDHLRGHDHGASPDHGHTHDHGGSPGHGHAHDHGGSPGHGHTRDHSDSSDHDHGHSGAGDHKHDHSHGGHRHGHSHGHEASERRLVIALLILGTFTLVEAIGGYFAHSIALLAEAAHMLADSASLVLAIMALRIGRRPADPRRTYGHRRYQPLAAFVNGQALLLLTIWVIYEAIVRLMGHPQVNGQIMLAVAVAGGVANLAAFLALSGAHSLNERGARAHVLSDLLGSGAASGAAILILTLGWTLADPLLSLLVSALILRSAWSLTRESTDVLLEGVPAGFELSQIEAALIGHVPGLIGVHHVHAWSMTGERPMVTLHAHLAPGTRHHEVITAIHLRLGQQLNVEHTTVQIEEAGTCEGPECGPSIAVVLNDENR